MTILKGTFLTANCKGKVTIIIKNLGKSTTEVLKSACSQCYFYKAQKIVTLPYHRTFRNVFSTFSSIMMRPLAVDLLFQVLIKARLGSQERVKIKKNSLKKALLKTKETFWSFSKISQQIMYFNFVIFCDFDGFERQILEIVDSGK